MRRADCVAGQFRLALIGLCATLAACGGPPPVAAPERTTVRTVEVTQPEADEVELTTDEEYRALAELLLRPATEQVAEWRNWAQGHPSARLRSQALAHLAWIEDGSTLELATAGISSPSLEVQAQAARVLTHVGLPRAASARAPLVAALERASDEVVPELVWALVVLEEPRVFAQAMQLYQRDRLSDLTRLDGGPAFDPRQLARLDPKLAATHAGSARPELRRLAAAGMAAKPESSQTAALERLAADRNLGVASEAVCGLARMGTKASRQALAEVLKGARTERFNQLVSALRDDAGTAGLVLALDGLSGYTKAGWYRAKTVLDAIEGATYSSEHGLNDPRGGDALHTADVLRSHVHWRTRAAFALARIGDLRAVAELAVRLRMDPLKIYSDDNDWEMMLKRDDHERVVATRLIADLAAMHPDQLAQIRQQAEDAVEFWALEMPSPHANAMRALAAMRSTKHVDLIRSWANPKVPLPKPGQQPPMPEEWVVAQSALRYAGQMQDKKSWPVLLKALKARPKNVDASMESLLQGGLAILGMSLRAIGFGASQGLSEWGDPRAFGPLLAYAEEPRENDQSRMEACAALRWVGTHDDQNTLLQKLRERDDGEKPRGFMRACLLEALALRPDPSWDVVLFDILQTVDLVQDRRRIAKVLGRGGFGERVEAKLMDALKDEVLGVDAAAALLLGADADTAVRAVAALALNAPAGIEEVASVYGESLGFWSYEDLEQGRIFRWVENALAISRAPLPEKARAFARVKLQSRLDDLLYDNGPHSLTRPVFRHRLLGLARSQDPATRRGALQTLLLAGEQGVLLALREELANERSDWANDVRRAYREVTSPASPYERRGDDPGER